MKKEVIKHIPSSWENRQERATQYANESLREYINKIQLLYSEFDRIDFDTIKSRIEYALGMTGHYGTSNYAYNYLYHSNQLNKAWFEYNMNEDKLIKLHIANKIVETIGKFNQTRSIGAIGVANSIRLAFILRDKEALAFYATIPFEFIEKEVQHHFIYEIPMALFQTLIKGIGNENEAHGAYFEYRKQLDWDEFKQCITRTSDFLSIDIWHDHIFKWVKSTGELLVLPELAIYHCILQKDQASFKQAVYDALLKWKEYYTMQYIDSSGEEKDHTLLAEGYWAIPIIAACAFAYDRGMKLENVESDYLCNWMIEGRFEDFELLIKD
ncbi:MAG: immunity 49 family protein [Arcicella sp.]|jgi:hypothetical protein|nr:immunity 49 family protein [Arcicella sp.]